MKRQVAVGADVPRAPVPEGTRQTQQISAEAADPLTQHEEGEGTN